MLTGFCVLANKSSLQNLTAQIYTPLNLNINLVLLIIKSCLGKTDTQLTMGNFQTLSNSFSMFLISLPSQTALNLIPQSFHRRKRRVVFLRERLSELHRQNRSFNLISENISPHLSTHYDHLPVRLLNLPLPRSVFISAEI